MIRTIARPMLAAIFLASGLDALRHPAKHARTATPLLDKVIPMLGLPDDKELLVRANGVAMLAGGSMLATGRLPRVASTVLAGTLVPTTLAGHSFWDNRDPETRAQDRIQLLKNIGLLGGLLLASVDTAGKPSLAWRAQRKRQQAATQSSRAGESHA